MEERDFEDWLEMVFKQDDPSKPADFSLFYPDIEEPAPYIFAEWQIRAYSEPEVLDRFTANEIGFALWQELPHIYADLGLPLTLRRKAFQALPKLFSGIFARRCSPCLGHKSESQPDTDYLNHVCYMWWDISPFSVGAEWATDEDRADFLAVCRTCLSSSNPAVQESALHGLGENYWSWSAGRSILQETISSYLNSGRVADPRLLDYAWHALVGNVN